MKNFLKLSIVTVSLLCTFCSCENDENNSIKENDFSSTYTNVIKEFYFVVYFDLYKNKIQLFIKARTNAIW